MSKRLTYQKKHAVLMKFATAACKKRLQVLFPRIENSVAEITSILMARHCFPENETVFERSIVEIIVHDQISKAREIDVDNYHNTLINFIQLVSRAIDNFHMAIIRGELGPDDIDANGRGVILGS